MHAREAASVGETATMSPPTARRPEADTPRAPAAVDAELLDAAERAEYERALAADASYGRSARRRQWVEANVVPTAERALRAGDAAGGGGPPRRRRRAAAAATSPRSCSAWRRATSFSPSNCARCDGATR